MEMVKPAERRADARRNRDRVLQAAIRHFTDFGIGASLEDVARAAGVGVGTLYRHFPSREALIAEALGERREWLLLQSKASAEMADADAALAAWLAALQDYLRTFNGLPEPVLKSIEQQASPLALTCQDMLEITGEFLGRAQRDGHARAALRPRELFLAALGIAWAIDRAIACGGSADGLNELLAQGYRTGSSMRAGA